MKNSFKNMFGSVLSNVITIIVGLVAQAVFIRILGTEYLGLNSLFANIISMLSIVELGMGSAIIYNMYKPIKENDHELIKSLMQYYKKAYLIITIVILVLGLVLIPFLQYLVDLDSVTININVYLVYILFLLDSVASYILSYKRSMLYANQKNYIINLIHVGYTLVLNISQLIILYFTRNFYYYLIIKIICRLLENVIITLTVNKQYPFVNDKKVKKLDKKITKDITQKIKALFFHKIGGFVVLGTDNIIIAKMINLVTVGLYSNYYLIINAVQTVFTQVITSLTPGVGNLLVDGNKEKSYLTFKRIRFINFWLATFSATCVLVIMDSFIKIWLGNEYILARLVLFVLTFNLYQKLMRSTYQTFKEAAGIYYEDRFVPIVESVLNILFSILLCLKFGLAGIFMGTIISGLALWCFSYPKYVYKKLFNRRYLNYFMETFGYIVIFILISSSSYLLSNLLHFSPIYDFIKNCLIGLIVPNIFLFLIYFRTDLFKYFYNLVISKIPSKLFKLFHLLVICISISISSLMIYLLLRIGILDWVILIITIILFVLIILGYILINKSKPVLKLFGYFILLMIILFSLIGVYFGRNTKRFFDNSFGNVATYNESNYYVVTNKNNKNNKYDTLGYLLDMPNVTMYSKEHNNIILNQYNTIDELFSLMDNNGYALFEKNTYEVYFSINKTLNKDNYRIVNQYKYQEKSSNKGVPVRNNHNINIYLTGTDFTQELHDFNMVLTINPDNHKMLLTSIPRDYYLKVSGTNYKDKIGYHNLYGSDKARDSIENLLGIKINYTIYINTNSLVELVNTIGGIDYCSNMEYTTTHALVLDTYDDSRGEKLLVKKGCYHYNGLETLTIARERLAFSDGDRTRQKNCQKIFTAIYNKMITFNSVYNYSNILNDLSNLYTTNMTQDVAIDMINSMIKNRYQLSYQSLNGYDSNNKVLYNNINDYVMVPYQGSITKCTDRIHSL